MSSFSRLLAYARPYKGRLAAAVAAMLFYAAASAGLVTLIKPLMDGVLGDRLDITLSFGRSGRASICAPGASRSS